MPLVVRATTTNVHGRKQRVVQPPTKNSNGLELEYVHALKVIQQSCQEQNRAPTIKEKNARRSDVIQQKYSKPSFQFSSTLTSIGQEAMIKTYEDTLISHLANAYPIEGMSTILPRLQTAAYRHRPSMKNTGNKSHLENIHRAQILIDSILKNDYQKDDMLGDYARWQKEWTKDFS